MGMIGQKQKIKKSKYEAITTFFNQLYFLE